MDAKGLFIADNEFEKKLSELKRQFHSRMNGETAAQMRGGNLGYEVNYGASLMHIREIAAEWQLSAEECKQLWQLSIREARIVALMAYPDDNASLGTLKEWADGVSNSELVELSAQYLFARQAFADDFIIALCDERAEYTKALAFYTAGRVLQRGKNLSDRAFAAMDKAVEDLGDTSVCEQRALSFFGRQTAHRDPERAKKYIDMLNAKSRRELASVTYDIENELF